MKFAMKFAVILESSGGELDRAVITAPLGVVPDDWINNAIHDVIEDWILSIGDTIEIVELTP
jgi:hypothetical protein